MSAQKTIAAEPPAAIEDSRPGAEEVTHARAIVSPRAHGAKLSDAWSGRFLSVPGRYRRILAKLFQRSYLERDEKLVETGRTLSIVPFAELARCTSSSRSTAARALAYFVKEGVVEIVEGDYFTDGTRSPIECKTSIRPRRDDAHRMNAGASIATSRKESRRCKANKARTPRGGCFSKEHRSGSETGIPNVYAIHVQISGDELEKRRELRDDVRVGARHRAWGPELDGFLSSDREVFSTLLAHANYGRKFPELRDCAWPSIDGRKKFERGQGAMPHATQLSRSTLYRAIARLESLGKLEKVMLRAEYIEGRKTVVGVWRDGDRELGFVHVRGWRILAAPLDGYRPGLVMRKGQLRARAIARELAEADEQALRGEQPKPVDCEAPGGFVVPLSSDLLAGGRADLGSTPGQGDTSPLVNMGHEETSREDHFSKGGSPIASPAATVVERPSAADPMSAAPTGAGDEPRRVESASPVPLGGASLADDEKKSNTGTKSNGRAIIAPPPLSPVMAVLFAVAPLFAQGIAPADWSNDWDRRAVVSRALNRKTDRSTSKRFTVEQLIVACQRAKCDPHFGSRRYFRISYVLGSAERIEELLDDDRPAARAARALEREQRMRALEAERRRAGVDDGPELAGSLVRPLEAYAYGQKCRNDARANQGSAPRRASGAPMQLSPRPVAELAATARRPPGDPRAMNDFASRPKF
jgi:hypothetical protein